jgi:hypothetical protein
MFTAIRQEDRSPAPLCSRHIPFQPFVSYGAYTRTEVELKLRQLLLKEIELPKVESVVDGLSA